MMMNGGGAEYQKNPPSTNVWIGDLPPDMDQDTFVQVFQQYGQIASAKLCPPKAPGAKASGFIRFQSQAEATWVVDTLHGNIAMGLTDAIVCNYAAERPAMVAKGGAPAMAMGGFGGGCDGGKGKGGGKWGKGGGKDGGGSWGELAGLVAQMTGKGSAGDSYDGGASLRSQPYDAASKGGGKAAGKMKGGCGKGGKSECDAVYMAVKNAGLIGTGKAPAECELYVGNIPQDSSDLFLFKLFSPFGAIAHTGAKAMVNPDGSCKGFAFVDFVDPGAAQTAVATLNGMTLPDGRNLVVCLKADTKAKGSGGGGGKGKGKNFGDGYGGYDGGWDGGFGDPGLLK